MKWEEASHNLSRVTFDTAGFKARTTSVKQPRHGIHSMFHGSMQQKRFVFNLKKNNGQRFYRELTKKKKKSDLGGN